MEQIFHNFLDATAKVNGILTSLIELGLEKQQLIIFNQINDLDNLIRKEGIIVNNLTRAEQLRYDEQKRLARVLELRPEELTASVLLAKVNEKYSMLHPELNKELNDLTHQLSQLKAINTHNNELIGQSLDYIDEMQALLSGDIAGTYSSYGEQEDEETSRPRMNLLDKKV